MKECFRVKKQHDAAVGAAATAGASAGDDGFRTVVGVAAPGPSGSLRVSDADGVVSSIAVSAGPRSGHDVRRGAGGIMAEARVVSSAGAGGVRRGTGGVVAEARVASSAGAGGVRRGAGGVVAEARVASSAGAGGSEGVLTPEARVALFASNTSVTPVSQSACSLGHKSSLARSCADGDESGGVGVSSAAVFAASGVAALPVRRSTTYALAAANACRP